MSDVEEPEHVFRPRPVRRPWVPGAVDAACSLGVAFDLDDDASFVLDGGVEEMLGWTRRELAMIPAAQLIHPDDQGLFDAPGRGDDPGHVPFVPIAVRVLSRDSRYWWTRWHLCPGPADEPLAFGDAVMRPDIDDGPAVGVWEWDPDTDTVIWSRELLDMFGFLHRPPATSRRALEVVSAEDRDDVAGHASRALACGTPFVVTFRSAAPGRRDRWFQATGRRIDHDGHRRLGGLVKDLNPACIADRPGAIGSG